MSENTDRAASESCQDREELLNCRDPLENGRRPRPAAPVWARRIPDPGPRIPVRLELSKSQIQAATERQAIGCGAGQDAGHAVVPQSGLAAKDEGVA